jgi:hypothetical protein
MKTKLLLIILPIALITSVFQAQEKVWDFGNDTTNWPERSSAITTTTVVDGLTLEPGNGSGFGIIDGNNASWGEDYSATQRFKFGGNSGIDPAGGVDFIPTRRYMSFSVDGPVSVKIWFRASGSSTPRALYVTDGTSTVTHFDSTGSTDPEYVETDYNGPAGQLYVLCAGNAFNLYKIEISSTLLSNNKFETSVSSHIKAVGSTVYVSNVKSATQVDIYSITGARVKSFSTNNDTNFDFNSGFYIATVKTAEGQKSVKMIVR